MIYKSFNPLLFLFFYINVINAQISSKANNDSILKGYKMSIINVKTHAVLVYKKNDIPKPTVIIIRGSDFIPFFVNGVLTSFPASPYPYGDSFNFIMISKPSISVFEDSLTNKYINKTYLNGYTLDSSGNVPYSFLKNNNCNYYVNQYNDVINYLSKQKWVDKNKIYLMGHSQGASIAASIALKTNKIAKIVLMSPGSIYSRFHESIRTIRNDEIYSLFSHETAQNKIDSIYNRFNELLSHKMDNVNKFDGGTYYSYYSFTYPLLKDKILKIKQKTLVVYGTESIKDIDCDYLPLELVSKKNILLKSYIGYDHNYYSRIPQKENGSFEQKFNWDKVFDDCLKWLNN